MLRCSGMICGVRSVRIEREGERVGWDGVGNSCCTTHSIMLLMHWVLYEIHDILTTTTTPSLLSSSSSTPLDPLYCISNLLSSYPLLNRIPGSRWVRVLVRIPGAGIQLSWRLEMGGTVQHTVRTHWHTLYLPWGSPVFYKDVALICVNISRNW